MDDLAGYAISPDGKMGAFVPADDLSLHIFDGKKTSKISLNGIKVNHAAQIPGERAGLVGAGYSDTDGIGAVCWEGLFRS